MRKILLIFGLFLAGCRYPQQRVDPRLVDPPYGGVIFIQSAATQICNGCTQQIFTVTLPKVGDGDTVKIALYWFASYFVNNAPTVPANPIASDSVGSTYELTQMATINGSPVKFGYIFSAPNVNSGGNSVTFQVALPFATGNYTAMVALEYSGGSISDGQSARSVVGPSPANSGPLNLTSDQDVVVSIYFGNLFGTGACGACNLRFSGASFVVQDSFPTASGSYTAQFSNTGGFGLYTVAAAGFQ